MIILCTQRKITASIENGAISPCLDEIGAKVAICMHALVFTSNCSYLFGIAHTIQDLCIQNIEFLATEEGTVSQL